MSCGSATQQADKPQSAWCLNNGQVHWKICVITNNGERENTDGFMYVYNCVLYNVYVYIYIMYIYIMCIYIMCIYIYIMYIYI